MWPLPCAPLLLAFAQPLRQALIASISREGCDTRDQMTQVKRSFEIGSCRSARQIEPTLAELEEAVLGCRAE